VTSTLSAASTGGAIQVLSALQAVVVALPAAHEAWACSGTGSCRILPRVTSAPTGAGVARDGPDGHGGRERHAAGRGRGRLQRHPRARQLRGHHPLALARPPDAAAAPRHRGARPSLPGRVRRGPVAPQQRAGSLAIDPCSDLPRSMPCTVAQCRCRGGVKRGGASRTLGAPPRAPPSQRRRQTRCPAAAGGGGAGARARLQRRGRLDGGALALLPAHRQRPRRLRLCARRGSQVRDLPSAGWRAAARALTCPYPNPISGGAQAAGRERRVAEAVPTLGGEDSAFFGRAHLL